MAKMHYDHAKKKFVPAKENMGRAGEGGRKKGVSHNYPSTRRKAGQGEDPKKVKARKDKDNKQRRKKNVECNKKNRQRKRAGR